MQAKKYCLILAAGFGTRMGPIGKTLPKVMWPIFEKSLLELQVLFAKTLGYQNIYINLYHQADEILERTKDNSVFKNVTWLRESPEILDIGGGIHNLARRSEINYSGELLVLNADQFLWFNQTDLDKWKKQAGDFDGLLLTWIVNSDQGYNQVGTDPQGRFTGVIPNSSIAKNSLIETYSGNSIIKLDRLTPQGGPSSFFDSICPATKKIMTAKINAKNYWDFGTAKRYYESMFKILRFLSSGQTDEFIDFLISNSALIKTKANTQNLNYGCDVESVINLGSMQVGQKVTSSIVLSSEKDFDEKADKVIIFQDQIQPLS